MAQKANSRSISPLSQAKAIDRVQIGAISLHCNNPYRCGAVWMTKA